MTPQETKLKKQEDYITVLESRIDYLESMLESISNISTDNSIKDLANTAVKSPMVDVIKNLKKSL